MGINDGIEDLDRLRSQRHLRLYHLTGRLGRSTLDYSDKGKILERTTFHHVTPNRMEKVLSKLRACYQKATFETAGVQPGSQEAYELASKGLIRPQDESAALFYGIKCLSLERPFFTLEILACNENDWYLKTFVHELGYNLKSTACYSKIRRLRYGHFTLDHALLRKHWTLEHIVNNIAFCRHLVQPKHLLTSATLGDNRVARKDNNSKYLETIPSDIEPDAEMAGLLDFEEEDEQLFLSSGGEIEHRQTTRPELDVPQWG